MEKIIETSFERMKKAVSEVIKEELGVNVIACNSHTSCTLKVVAIPQKENCAEVYIPYQIFVGARTNDTCSNWSVDNWKMGLRKLCLEFGVKDCPRTRLMTKRSAQVSPRLYANYFWSKVESMKGWNIILPEFPKAQPVGAEILQTAAQLAGSEDVSQKAQNNLEVQKAFELMGLKFCCM